MSTQQQRYGITERMYDGMQIPACRLLGDLEHAKDTASTQETAAMYESMACMMEGVNDMIPHLGNIDDQIDCGRHILEIAAAVRSITRHAAAIKGIIDDQASC